MARISAVLLGALLCLCFNAASARRSLFQSGANATLTGLVTSTDSLSSLETALTTAGLASVLDAANGTYTVFAPTDAAFAASIKSMYCIKDYGFAKKCANISDLLASQNLATTLLNHVVVGSFPASSLTNGTVLKTVGGALQRVAILSNGTVTVGGAPVVAADVAATNGIAHVVGAVLYRDAAFNTSTISSYLNTIADLGPQTTSAQSFSEAEKTQMVQDALDNVDRFRSYRSIVQKPDGGYLYPMPMLFDNTQGNRENFCTSATQPKWTYPALPSVTRPADNETLAYMTVMELAALIQSKQVTSMELVELYTARLKQYDPYLEAVVTYTTDLAYEQAQAADAALANGTYLGPLHGIPYGLKDLIAVPPYRTTWGSGAFINQVIPREATVYTKLKDAGAVLVAKLSTGEMATGDEWWGGKTKCPWNIAVGASGSSAGPGAATAAGLVGFALGTETGGSIIGPAATNGVAGLRPSFGLTSRAYCMALSQTLDKVGPLARSAEDAAVIFDTIRGKDGIDTSACNVALDNPFNIDVSSLTIGYLPDTPAAALKIFNETMGLKLVPVAFANSAPDFSALYEVIRGAEFAAYFDYWLRSGNIENNTVAAAWPLRARRSRMIPAVEYIQAMRVRGVSIAEAYAAFGSTDVFLGPSSNYTSHGNIVNIPEIAIPYGFAAATTPSNYTDSTPRKNPLTVGIYGLPYSDSKVLAVAMAFQKVNDANRQRPPINLIEPEVLANCTSVYSRCNLPATTLAKLTETGINNPPVQIKDYAG